MDADIQPDTEGHSQQAADLGEPTSVEHSESGEEAVLLDIDNDETAPVGAAGEEPSPNEDTSDEATVEEPSREEEVTDEVVTETVTVDEPLEDLPSEEVVLN